MAALPCIGERRAFWWTCGWLSVLSLTWTGHFIFSYIVDQKLAKLAVIADGDYLPELERYYLETDPWLNASRTVVILLATGFVACLARWLLAIRHRRRTEVGDFPQA